MNEDDPWYQFAKHWQKAATRADQDVIQKLYTALEAETYSLPIVSKLDNSQVVEKYLWPTFSEDSSNQHVLLLAALINYKAQAGLLSWTSLASRPEQFSQLFHRILSLNLDYSLPTTAHLTLLNFAIHAFQSLEQDSVRKQCAPLVSIATWHNLHSEEAREKQLDKTAARKKAWRSSQRRFEAADQVGQMRLQFERGWFYSMVLNFLKRLNAPTATAQEVVYCERFLELLIDITSQLPTRRYTTVLLSDLNVLPVIRLSQMFRRGGNENFRDLTALYHHFNSFNIDDAGSLSDGDRSSYDQKLLQCQKVALQHFEPKLKVFALSNLASIRKEGELRSQFSSLSDIELEQFCQLLGFRIAYPPTAGISAGRPLFEEILVVTYAKAPGFEEVMHRYSVLPTEISLYDPTLLRNETYDGSRPLALSKLGLQYLTLSDFLWRSFQLHQAEAFYEIRKDMENIVRKMKPRLISTTKGVAFDGFSKMAMPIAKPAIIDVGQPKVGSTEPGHVRAEVVLDVSRLGDRVRSEWDNLRPKDVVFLLSVKTSNTGQRALTNGTADHSETSETAVARLRAAEVVQVLDDKGKAIRDDRKSDGYTVHGRSRRLLLDIDPVTFQQDKEQLSKGKPDVYASINVIARRAGRENNFKPVLETIKSMVDSQTKLPSWLEEVFMGYGDPQSATYTELPNRVESVDFLDTFLDWQHLQESFPTRKVQAEDNKQTSPPFVLEPFTRTAEAETTNPRKRRREQMENEDAFSGPVTVSSYNPVNNGPYPVDVPPRNSVRFTPTQVRAIVSGTQPGLSIIVGPPGTGKTDVATQIINLLYHNFPSERILLIAHSNQALNQLFQKIIALDIDARHLLRLGHGEEELEAEASYSKYGRVESFMDNRQTYLNEVNRLAGSIDAEGAHGSTCETADYFNQVFIQPAWTKFWSVAKSPDIDKRAVVQAFPFHKFFSNAPVPELFPENSSLDEYLDIASGCQRHLDKVFTELETIRPFELLRHPRDQANHLLVKEARIIAMTSTHAAIRRSEIASVGFHYDTLIMEEAAQITEIESFVPCAMQKPDPKTGELPLKRVVLIGDHLQNSPVIQNLALRQYANYEQSLFLRFVRLGVPTITLDAQGRCRPSLAQLFSWRYPSLKDLPHTSTLPEFLRANAGFAHEFQFINVDEYNDQGEREPTPHFIQNLGEAEYAVALYQYMRLLGYPAKSISILATYAGQTALIRDVLNHRCKGNTLFGMPRAVSTVDKYQGEQNDYVILSLVRTKSVGYLRDVRRLTVALSRARLGLYILGRKALWETCQEMEIAMQRLSDKGGNADGNLEVVTGEMFPTNRKIGDELDKLEDGKQVVEMHGVEHLGKYVYEMTQAKVKQMGGTVLANAAAVDDDEGVADLDDEAEGDVEEDPLHETA